MKIKVYGEDGLPNKCTQCLKDRTQVSFPACDAIPVCFDCHETVSNNGDVQK